MTANVVQAMLAYAAERTDAEAAAMRERAAGVADKSAECMRAQGSLCGEREFVGAFTEAEAIAAAIRALPATGEVGRG